MRDKKTPAMKGLFVCFLLNLDHASLHAHNTGYPLRPEDRPWPAAHCPASEENVSCRAGALRRVFLTQGNIG